MELSLAKRLLIIFIVIITCISTGYSFYVFVGLFFFISFINPVLIIGTSPLLLLCIFADKGKKKRVVISWIILLISLFIIGCIWGYIIATQYFRSI